MRQDGVIEKMVSWSWDNNPYSAGAFCWWAPGQHEALYRDVIAPEGRLFFAGEHAFHSKQEWVSVQDMEKAAETIVHLAQVWEEKQG